MRIVLCCATNRGLRFAQEVRRLRPNDDLVVLCFREEPHEPPFFDGIRAWCEQADAVFIETRVVGSSAMDSFWADHPVDLLFAVSWRYMIPRHVRERARLGSFVFHDSMLPAYRGFSPTVWAMANGETQTGVSLISMEEEVDSGDLVDQVVVPIGPSDRIDAVMESVTRAYLEMLGRNMPALAEGRATRRPQDAALASWCCRRLPSDNEIDWARPTRDIHNLIRAVSRPYPGAFTYLEGRRMIVWDAQPHPDGERYVGRVPGRVVQVQPGRGSVVLTGDSALMVREIGWDQDGSLPADRELRSIGMTLGRRQ